jgi:hypothetical protein
MQIDTGKNWLQDKEDIVYECLKILDEIATTHADSGTYRKIALAGINTILKMGEKDEEMAY